MDKFYLTTPIYYANGRPHIGHVYCSFAADAIRRFQGMLGREACLTTGTDEHGQKMQETAKKLGLEPRELADRYSANFRAVWDELGIQYDHFIRTTEARHIPAVYDVFRRCQEAGAIYKSSYTGAYCMYDEAFVTEVAPGEPCPECKRPTQELTEENYFFRLSDYAERLLKLYEEHPDFIRPEARRNEVISFVRGGLKDLSISRTSVSWGIPVPDAPGHVFYVWFDALISYMSAIGYGQGEDAEKEWQRLWPANLHLVGKEIVRFHAVYWPAFLMAAGLPLPRGIYAHGLMLIENDKISKSRGNLILAEPITRTVGADALRYFLAREIVFGQDGSFSYDALVTRFNSDLANGLGNLVSRTLTMITRYFGGRIPEPQLEGLAEERVYRKADEVIQEWREHFENLEFSLALESVWSLIAEVDRYIVHFKPWELAEKGERERLAAVLYTCADVVRMLCRLIYPVMPESARRIWKMLGETKEIASAAHLRPERLQSGQKIGAVEAVFPRLEAGPIIQKMRDMEQEQLKTQTTTSAAAAPAAGEATAVAPALAPQTGEAAPATPPVNPPVNPKITIDDFSKVEMRVGTVVKAERIPKADKLLKLTVDIGSEVRQVLAGIAEAYAPEDLPGKKVVIVANLAPRKLRGLESNGMVVAAAVEPDGKPVLVTVPDSVPNGARLR
jgi:methionyl-tRNA synthetase